MPGRARFAESRARYYIRDQARRRGWNVGHVANGGDFLEENEIINRFPNIGLGLNRPDFLLCIAGEPRVVIEAKNEAGKIDIALQEAIDYANTINATGQYDIRLAVGASGTEEQGFIVAVEYFTPGEGWTPLIGNGFALTALPSRPEAELAIAADDATTTVSVPTQNEFIDAAIELSRTLRMARVEAPARPKVIGALVLAMYESAIGQLNLDGHAGNGGAASGATSLIGINQLVRGAIDEIADIPSTRKQDLIESLQLTGPAYQQLEGHIGRLVAILRRLNVRAVMHSHVDFLGTFYEAFLRYGYDNNALGIVFTPRHITSFCTELIDVTHDDKVIDLACGTGGFLVSAFDRMMSSAPSAEAREQARESLAGFDPNPTVWALAVLNMYFRGDGKSQIERSSSLTPEARSAVRRQYDKAFLNPPFSQQDEPERQFITASMDACRAGGLAAVVVKAGVFADDDHKLWRGAFMRSHSVLGVISLPDDLFYPTAAPTSILIARAHVPQSPSDLIYLARVSNDGFEKLKGKRVPRSGSELTAVLESYRAVRGGVTRSDSRSMTVTASDLMGGKEWSPQEWLPQPHTATDLLRRHQELLAGSVLQTVARYPDLAEKVIANFTEQWTGLPQLPYGSTVMEMRDLFKVSNGKSSGEKNYLEGEHPYISSGDQANSIVNVITGPDEELFTKGGITVTAFGQAFVQPWPFFARGNGGSAVRVLEPRYALTMRELLWFAAQINVQRWRFFYARMAIKGRIERLALEIPDAPLGDSAQDFDRIISSFLRTYNDQRNSLSGLG